MGNISFELIWIIAIIFFSVVEAATAGLISIWFAAGSLVALIAAIFGANFYVQLSLFFAVSILTFIFVRKWALENIKNKTEKTDIARLIGKKIIIKEAVDNLNNKGSALINDVEWKVRSCDDSVIEKNSVAVVEKIEGVKLIVRKESEE